MLLHGIERLRHAGLAENALIEGPRYRHGMSGWIKRYIGQGLSLRLARFQCHAQHVLSAFIRFRLGLAAHIISLSPRAHICGTSQLAHCERTKLTSRQRGSCRTKRLIACRWNGPSRRCIRHNSFSAVVFAPM